MINSFFNRYTKKFIAFTLAETLIVMGIIGVVAALTIPNLNSSTGDVEKITKFKKTYAELNEAHERAVAVYGSIENWFLNDCSSDTYYCEPADKRYFDRIVDNDNVDYLKASHDQNNSTTGICNNDSSKQLGYNAGQVRSCK